jgi:hypothetical protein
MTKIDAWIYTQVTTFSDAESIAIVGPARKRELWKEFSSIKRLTVNLYDYDPQRASEDIITADVVFDIELKEDLIINYACEKMWPLGKIYKGREFILIGDNEKHNGDCNPIISNKMLIEQNELTEVWSFNEINRWGDTKYFMVYGCN